MIIYPQQRFRNSSNIIQNFENNKISTELLKNIIKASAIFIKPAQNLCDFYKRMIENINQKFNNEEIARKIRNCLNSTEPKNDKDQEVPELLKTILECTHTKYNEIYTKYNEIYTNKDTNMENFDENQGKEDAEGLEQLLSYIRYKELNNIGIINEIYIQLVNIMQQIGTIVDIIKREKLGEVLKRP